MRRLALIIYWIALLVTVSLAQSTGPTTIVRFGSTLPTTCNPSGPNVFFKTSATVGLYQCLTLNNWTAVGAGGGGSGTVTVVGAGNLTSTAIVTGGGSQTIQTPSATATLDSSGNVSTPGSMSTGVGGSVAGTLELIQGTAPSAGTTSIKIYAPASVTSYILKLPAAAASGIGHYVNSSGVVTQSISAVVEADITLADNTTNNVSITAHGFAPKAPNDATKYLDGTGAYSVPAGGGGGGSQTPWTATIDGDGFSLTDSGDLIPRAGSILGSAALPWLSTFTGNTTQYESVVQTAGIITHSALGSATNIGITLTAKGTGQIKVTSLGSASSPSLVVGAEGIYSRANGALNIQNPAFGATSNHFEFVGQNWFSMTAGTQVQWASSTTDSVSGVDTGIKRNAVAVVEVNNGTAGGFGLLLAGRVVTAKTSNYTVVTADKSTFFSNTGAAGGVTFTLPTAAVGNTYEFYRDANQTVTIVAGASTTIRVGASVTAAAGNITLDAVGSRIRLVAISTTQWVGDLSGAATFN